MKISYNWLKEIVELDLPVEKIAEILTETGLEVDGIEKIQAIEGGLEGVVIGEVLTCEKHPDADKLKVTSVSIGESEPLQIVCGAPNVAIGQKVVVATVGCTLYPKSGEKFKIKSSKIRGVESQGMLCAEDEIGLGESHAGIMVLKDNVKVGIPAASYFELEDDYQIEIGLTPNRADAMGHIGVARDLKAYLNFHKKINLKLNWPITSDLKEYDNQLPHEIIIENADLCPHYAGVSIQGVKIEPSPNWLQNRLRNIGIQPINNVVDITNYVMRELGTPLHAFDCNALNGKIVVKNANSKDKFKTLDGIERELDASNLMITNDSEYLAIAGVFGGIQSGISNVTTNIFIESAYFNPVSVRKTAKFHALNTDASFRFERGVDPALTIFALKRAAFLILDIAGGKIAMEFSSVNPKKIENQKISFRPEQARKIIGHNISNEEIEFILNELDFIIHDKNDLAWNIEIPAYRVDVTREIDVIEEVLRIYGLNNIPFPEKLNSSITLREKPNLEKINQITSEFLVNNGFFEILNNSLTSSSYNSKFDSNSEKSQVKILNPLSQDLNTLRQNLLFNTLEVIEFNQNRQNADLKLFEFGKTYEKADSTFIENNRLIISMTGISEPENWNSSKNKTSFYDIKGLIISMLSKLGLSNYLIESSINESLLEDGVCLHLLKEKIGELGWISKAMKKSFGIKQDVFIADLDWDKIVNLLNLNIVIFKEIPKTFAMRRDFSLLLDEKIKFSEIEILARKIDKKLLKSIGLFDVYEGDKLEKGKKSYAVSFYFQDNEQTLKDEIVDGIMQKIRHGLETELEAQLR